MRKYGKMRTLETTSASLHLMAMGFMLLDHLWGTILLGNDWMNCLGRLAFPLFGFLVVEGYFHTRNLKRYVGRLFLFALLSELPFDLAMSGVWFYPLYQNVLWSFLISIGLITLNEKVRDKSMIIRVLVGVLTVLLGYLLGLLTMVDYYHAGILTVLVFYFFRKRCWWSAIGQILCLWYINVELLAGYMDEIHLFGTTIFFTRQGLALLALIPIWLYHGKQGYHKKWFQFVCYAFYPFHLLILGILLQR